MMTRLCICYCGLTLALVGAGCGDSATDSAPSASIAVTDSSETGSETPDSEGAAPVDALSPEEPALADATQAPSDASAFDDAHTEATHDVAGSEGPVSDVGFDAGGDEDVAEGGDGSEGSPVLVDAAEESWPEGLYGELPSSAVPVPEFVALNHDGSTRGPQDLMDKPTVMWFFPFAGTPG